MTSTNSGGTRIENPSPKNWNQDFVLQIPSRVFFCFLGGGGDASRVSAIALWPMEPARVRARVNGTVEMASLLEEQKQWKPLIDFKFKGDLGLGLGFWEGSFGGGERRRRRMAMAIKFSLYYSRAKVSALGTKISNKDDNEWIGILGAFSSFYSLNDQNALPAESRCPLIRIQTSPTNQNPNPIQSKICRKNEKKKWPKKHVIS